MLGRLRRIVSRNEKRSPADFVFTMFNSPGGCYLFEDGTVGYIADPEFDVEEFIDNPDWKRLDPRFPEAREAYIRSQFGGRMPAGNLYIDRWDTDGEFYQGGCFLYFEGETLGDWCDRNGEPYPVCDVPEDLYDAFEENDIESIIEIGRGIPEMRGIVKGLRR